MYRRSSRNHIKLIIATLLVVASAACSGNILPPDERDCRDEFEPVDGYRPLCEHVNPIQ